MRPISFTASGLGIRPETRCAWHGWRTDGYGPPAAPIFFSRIGWILQLAAPRARGGPRSWLKKPDQRLKGRFELACLSSLARSPPVRPSVRPRRTTHQQSSTMPVAMVTTIYLIDQSQCHTTHARTRADGPVVSPLAAL